METILHRQLKAAAADLLLQAGCAAVATEVACPISRYRIDAAGYLDALPVRRRRPDRPSVDGSGPAALAERCRSPRTIFIECKASRSDFLRDGCELPRLLALRERVAQRLRDVEQSYVRHLEPHLRRSGSSLFPELEDWDYAASRLLSHRSLVRRLRRLDHRIYNQTKFFMLSRYRLGDLLYVLAPARMIEPGELPRSWGLLELHGKGADGRPRVTLGRPGVPHSPKSEFLVRALRNIAAAATRDALRASAARNSQA